MVTAVLQMVALTVQLVESQHESWLEQNAGSMLLAAAAIAAASLAALVAIKNHRGQLEHDREMRNRDHTRDTIDVAVKGASRAVDDVSKFSAVVKAAAQRGYVPDRKVDGDALERHQFWEQEVMDSLKAAVATNVAMEADGVRLELRLGMTHPIVTSQSRLRRALSDWEEAVQTYLRDTNDSVAEPFSDSDHTTAVGDGYRDLRESCRRWFEDE